MKYISQLNAFWNWVRTNEISHLEADLYLSILDIANASLWKTQFTIPNSTLGRFDKNSLTRARNKLVQLGLIQYYPGKRGQAPSYSVVPLYDTSGETGIDISPNIDTNSDTDYKISPNNDTYIDTYPDTNNDTNLIPKQGTYIDKDKEKDKIKTITPYKPPFAGALGEKVDEWLRYKSERGQKYKPVGLKALYGKIQAAEKSYGTTAVIAAIDNSITNNWQGLFFDRLAPRKEGVYSDSYDHADLEAMTR